MPFTLPTDSFASKEEFQYADKTGVFVGLKRPDAPEGVLFIPASKSPSRKDLLLVSSEGDGFLRVYQNR